MAGFGLINYQGFSLADTPSLQGRVCVITGGQDGIGKEIVAQLLLHGVAKIYILARSLQKFESALQVWEKTHNLTRQDVIQRVEFLACDLSDIICVKRVADTLKGKLERLDMLINNAGKPPVADYTLSPQGIETIWATNVLGHFVLTQILLPKLETTAEMFGNARVVVTSSSLHMGCQELDFNLTMSPHRIYSPIALDSCWRYARSKLGNILFTRELARRLDEKGASNVYANVFFPGNIPTDAMDTWRNLFGLIIGVAIKSIFQIAGQSPMQAAATAIYLASSPDVVKKSQKGKYFIPIATNHKTSKTAEDKDLARKLWYWCDNQVTETLGKGWEESTDSVSDSAPE